MSVAAVIADLIRSGVDPDLVGRAAELMTAASKPADPTAEKRRAYDRERKRRAAEEKASGGIPVESGGVDLLEQKGFPTPLPKTQTSNPSEPKGSSGKTTHAREAADFERFWTAYPRKVGKGAARKAFPAACRKIGGEPIGVLLAGLERAKAMWRDPQFIPHPATWLSQERWTDEPASPPPPRPANDRPSPRPDDRFDRRQANLARAFAGAEVAAGLGDGWD